MSGAKKETMKCSNCGHELGKERGGMVNLEYLRTQTTNDDYWICGDCAKAIIEAWTDEAEKYALEDAGIRTLFSVAIKLVWDRIKLVLEYLWECSRHRRNGT